MNKNNSLVKRDNNALRREGDIDIFDTPTSCFPEVTINKSINEKDCSVFVRANINGIKEEDINISVCPQLKNAILTISGESKNTREDKNENEYFSATSYSSFSQSVLLPKNVDCKNIKKKYDGNILEITIPMVKKLISAHKKTKKKSI